MNLLKKIEFWRNRFNVNKALSIIGGASVLPNWPLYWSSTEYNATDAFYINFTTGASYDNAKTNIYSVRAVRAFQPNFN